MLRADPKVDPLVVILKLAHRRGLALRQEQENGATQSKEKVATLNGLGEQIGRTQESLEHKAPQKIGDSIKRLRFKKHTRLRKQKPRILDAKFSQVSGAVDHPDPSSKYDSSLDATSGDVKKV